MLVGQPNRFTMATRQFFRFALFAAAIDRAYRMDHMLCSQPSTACDYSLPRGQAADLAHNLPALGEDGSAAGAMNCSIDSTSAQER
jgi:hypothetical protein